MPHKIIQKDVTFDMSFTFPVWGAGKALSVLEQYNVEEMRKSWSWKKPFSISVFARVNIAHDIDITKMREKQHELLTNKKET